MRFFLVNSNTRQEYGFLLPGMSEPEWWDKDEDFDRDFDLIFDEIEHAYGILDGSASTAEDWVGFWGYQTEPEDFPRALERFRIFFEARGFETQPEPA
jgi:hypothetical protein